MDPLTQSRPSWANFAPSAQLPSIGCWLVANKGRRAALPYPVIESEITGMILKLLLSNLLDINLRLYTTVKSKIYIILFNSYIYFYFLIDINKYSKLIFNN